MSVEPTTRREVAGFFGASGGLLQGELAHLPFEPCAVHATGRSPAD
ncbi:MAG: hypothetical protein ABI555_00745 [Chloroflexota bacterium]